MTTEWLTTLLCLMSMRLMVSMMYIKASGIQTVGFVSGGGWFVVVAQLPTGQITNHYPMKDWEQFQIPERERANEWDGHTPEVALNRLKGMSALMDEMKEAERVKRHQQAILEKGFNRLVDGEGLE